MAKYRCPNCQNVFEGQPERCPQCNVKMTYPKRDEEVLEEQDVVEQAPVKEQPVQGKGKKKRIDLLPGEEVLCQTKINNLVWVYLAIGFFAIGAAALTIGIVNRVNGTNLWFRNLFWLIIAGAAILLGVLFLVLLLIFTTKLAVTDRRIIIYRGDYLHQSIRLKDIVFLSRSNGLLIVSTPGKTRRLYYVRKSVAVYDLLVDKVVK